MSVVRCGYCGGTYDWNLAPDFGAGFSCAVCRAWRSLRELLFSCGLPRPLQAELASRIRGFQGELHDFAESSGLVTSVRPTVWVPSPSVVVPGCPGGVPARAFGPIGQPGGKGPPVFSGPPRPGFAPSSPASTIRSVGSVEVPPPVPPNPPEVKVEATTAKSGGLPPPAPKPEPASGSVVPGTPPSGVKSEVVEPETIGATSREEPPPDYSGQDEDKSDQTSIPDTVYTYNPGGTSSGSAAREPVAPPPGDFSWRASPPSVPPPAHLLPRSSESPSRSPSRVSEGSKPTETKKKVKKKNKGVKKRERGRHYWSGWRGDRGDYDRDPPPPGTPDAVAAR
jgi:hypothetical protein